MAAYQFHPIVKFVGTPAAQHELSSMVVVAKPHIYIEAMRVRNGINLQFTPFAEGISAEASFPTVCTYRRPTQLRFLEGETHANGLRSLRAAAVFSICHRY